MLPGRKSGAFFRRQNPSHRIFEDNRDVIQKGPVDGANGLRVFDSKPESCSQHINGRFSVYIGRGGDDRGCQGHLSNLAGEIVCPTHMPRYETDDEVRPFVHDDDGRILRLVHQKTGDDPNHNPASHDEDMPRIQAKPTFHFGREPAEPDDSSRGIGGGIPLVFEVFRKKHVAG